MEECIFCNIVEGKIPSKTVYEDAHVKAFLDVKPSAPGHTLVIPKVHSETLADIPEDTIIFLFSGVRKVLRVLEESLSPNGFTVGINNGKGAGQEVDHLHIHLIPRWKDDGGGSINTVVNNTTNQSIDEIFETIKKHS